MHIKLTKFWIHRIDDSVLEEFVDNRLYYYLYEIFGRSFSVTFNNLQSNIVFEFADMYENHLEVAYELLFGSES